MRFIRIVEQVMSHCHSICCAMADTKMLANSTKHAINVLSENELLTIQTSIHEMLNALDDAVHLSADPPDQDPPQFSHTTHTGR